MRRRHREAQTGRAMCLSLVVNAIVCWNTAYLELALERALERLVETRGRIDPGLLGHISPAMLEHVNPYCTYDFPVEVEVARIGYRELREPESVEQGRPLILSPPLRTESTGTATQAHHAR